MLLPCVTSMLLLALNHAHVMGSSPGPQPWHLNLLMVPCVGITITLASVVLLKQTLGRCFADPTDGKHAAIVAAFPTAAFLLLMLLRQALRVRGPSRRQQVRAVLELNLGPLAGGATSPVAPPC